MLSSVKLKNVIKAISAIVVRLDIGFLLAIEFCMIKRMALLKVV